MFQGSALCYGAEPNPVDLEHAPRLGLDILANADHPLAHPEQEAMRSSASLLMWTPRHQPSRASCPGASASARPDVFIRHESALCAARASMNTTGALGGRILSSAKSKALRCRARSAPPCRCAPRSVTRSAPTYHNFAFGNHSSFCVNHADENLFQQYIQTHVMLQCHSPQGFFI